MCGPHMCRSDFPDRVSQICTPSRTPEYPTLHLQIAQVRSSPGEIGENQYFHLAEVDKRCSTTHSLVRQRNKAAFVNIRDSEIQKIAWQHCKEGCALNSEWIHASIFYKTPYLACIFAVPEYFFSIGKVKLMTTTKYNSEDYMATQVHFNSKTV